MRKGEVPCPRFSPELDGSASWPSVCCFPPQHFPRVAQLDPQTKQLSRDIFQQLIEINTTDSVGSTTVAANAMAQRLLDAGFAKEDVVVLGPNDRKGNLVARLHGTGAREAHPAHRSSGRGRGIALATGPPIRSSLSRRTATSTGAAHRT